jgi:hypothetical protein
MTLCTCVSIGVALGRPGKRHLLASFQQYLYEQVHIVFVVLARAWNFGKRIYDKSNAIL